MFSQPWKRDFSITFLSRTKNPSGSIVNWSTFISKMCLVEIFMSKVPNCKIYSPENQHGTSKSPNWNPENHLNHPPPFWGSKMLTLCFSEFLVRPGMASERMGSTWPACALWVLEPMIGRTLPLAQEIRGHRRWLGWSVGNSTEGFQKVWCGRTHIDIGWSFSKRISLIEKQHGFNRCELLYLTSIIGLKCPFHLLFKF